MKPVANAIEEMRHAVARSARKRGPDFSKQTKLAAPSGNLRNVRRILFDPLREAIGDAKLLLLSPTETLSRLPFAAIPGKKPGSYLIADHALVSVPVPRQLLPLLKRQPRHPGSGDSILLVGDVDFDNSVALGDRPPSAEPDIAPGKLLREVARSGRVMRFGALPGTEVELRQIARTFRDTDAHRISVLRQESATEKQFRRLAPKHRYIHVATHGFFAPSELRSSFEDAQLAEQGFEVEGLILRPRLGLHPGMLSGLAFAGVNRTISGEVNQVSAQNDGIITAIELAGLDLNQTELVMLSACETGLGDQVTRGEGLLGLQRAFQVSGAKTVVGTLWKVDDRATQVLMNEF